MRESLGALVPALGEPVDGDPGGDEPGGDGTSPGSP
jgi:hypothetical protein